MFKIILAVLIIGYGILITLMLELIKEIQRIHKILWKVAQNESLDFILKNSNQNSQKPINRS